MKQLFIGYYHLDLDRTWTAYSFGSFLYFLIYQVSLVNSEAHLGPFTSSMGFSGNATTSLNSVFTSFQRLSGIYQGSFNLLAKEIDGISVKSNRSRNSPCYTELSRILRHGFTTEWTAKLLQANSFMSNGHHLPSSLISEKFSSLGDFDACLSLRALPSQSSSYYKGKYCLVHLTTPQIDSATPTTTNSILPDNYLQQLAGKWTRMNNRLLNVNGICIPSLCSASEITTLIETQFAEYLRGITIQVKHCQISNSKLTPITKSDFSYNLARAILASFALLSLTCTLFSSFCLKPKSPLTQFAQSFNLQANLTHLWHIPSDTNYHESTLNLAFTAGLRVLLNAITIYVHCFIAFPASFSSRHSSFTPYSAYFTRFQSDTRLLEPSTAHGAFLMDHFFFLSGFLVAYIVCRKGRTLPGLLGYIAIRWFRLVPSLIGLFSLAFVLQKLGSGPLFHRQLTQVYLKPCRSHWWTHLLFLNNWTNQEETCEFHLWFLAADFQLSLLLYPILGLFLWAPIWAFTAIGGLIVASLSGLFAIIALARVSIPDFSLLYKFESPITNWRSLRLLHTSPQKNLFPYFIGVLLSFYLIKAKITLVASSFYQNCLIWMLIILLGVTILYPIPEPVKSDPLYETLCYLFRHLLHTLLSGVAFYRLLLVRGSALANLFTCPLFQPLSRLSYAMYLVHPALIWFNLSQIRVAQPLTTWYQIQFFLTIYVQSFLVSILLYVFVEKPFSNLIKKCSQRWEKDSQAS